MNAPLTLALAVVSTSEAYDRLARRVAYVWSIAIGGDTLEAARNAVAPLALDAACTEADARACFSAALTHRRTLGARGFARLLDSQIAYLVDEVAVPLWRSHREERGARATLPAPPTPCTYDVRCGRCDDCCSVELDDEHVEGPDYAYERAHSVWELG